MLFDWWGVMPTKPFGWMRWNAWVAILTAVSFGPVSMFALISVLDNLGPVVQFFGFALFGLAQGALIGFGQAIAMRNTDVSVPVKAWVLASMLGAGALWVLGQIPGYFVDIDYGNIFVSVGTIFVAIILLAFFGLVQWRILKHRVQRAWRWIIITVYSWLAGLFFFVLGVFTVRTDGRIVVIIAGLSVFGGLAVVLVATLSGLGMRMLARDSISNPRYGTILPNTPKFNAAKRQVAKATTKARVTGEATARKAAAKAAPVAKKAAAKAAPVAKKAASAAKSAVKKTASQATSVAKKTTPKKK